MHIYYFRSEGAFKSLSTELAHQCCTEPRWKVKLKSLKMLSIQCLFTIQILYSQNLSYQLMKVMPLSSTYNIKVNFDQEGES